MHKLSLEKYLLSLCITLLIWACGPMLFAQAFHQTDKVVASDRAQIDRFGYAVSIKGDRAVSGAFDEDEDVAGGNTLAGAGSAYLFELDGNGNWTQVQKITAGDRGADDNFGNAVAIYGDYAIIGAYKGDEDAAGANTLINAGSAYVFERDGNGVWSQVQKLTPADRALNDGFGWAVALYDNIAFIGATREDEDASGSNTLSDAGSVYVFERDGNGVWQEMQKIVPADRAGADSFGYSISISGDLALVGSPGSDGDDGGGNFMSSAGAAYVFERDISGVWLQMAKLVAADRTPFDFFGNAVSISGHDALIGAYLDREDVQGQNPILECGSAYFFEELSNGTWIQELKVCASDRGFDDYFGFTVAIDDEMALIGTQGEDEDANGINSLIDAGSVYLFEETDGGWRESEKMVPDDRAVGDFFGTSVSLSLPYAFIGSANEDEDANGLNTLTNAGSAYFFKFCRSGSADTVSACNAYQWGDSLLTLSGTYRDTLQNAEGCDSVVTLELSLAFVSDSVTATDSSLFSEATGVTYQWIDCGNGFTPVPGATTAQFYPQTPGSYAVIVSGACTDTSDCYLTTIAGRAPALLSARLKAQPNPTNGQFTVFFGSLLQQAQVRVFTPQGLTVAELLIQGSHSATFDLTAQPAGLFFVEVVTDEGQRGLIRVTVE